MASDNRRIIPEMSGMSGGQPFVYVHRVSLYLHCVMY
jgi:hypothetical protein